MNSHSLFCMECDIIVWSNCDVEFLLQNPLKVIEVLGSKFSIMQNMRDTFYFYRFELDFNGSSLHLGMAYGIFLDILGF